MSRLIPICFICIAAFLQGNGLQAQTVDAAINRAFTPVTEAVEAVVFWSFRLKEDVVYGREGVKRMPADFYEEPPFRIRWEDGENLPFGKLFTVMQDSSGWQLLSGKTRVTVTPGQQLNFEGLVLVLEPNARSAYGCGPGEACSFSLHEIRFLPITIAALIIAALFFTLYFRFINLRKFKLAVDVVSGRYSGLREAGEVSHFQALATALSGTVGLGNIAGVAVAIAAGGAGATFWMIVAGLLGMTSKFVECTLGVRYRRINADGVVSGGPMYYLRDGLARRGWDKAGKMLAVLFCFACIGGAIGGGNMIQSNQAFAQLRSLEFMQDTWLAQNGWMFGLMMAVVLLTITLGGIKSIARVTEKMVPLMCGLYLLAGLVIILLNWQEIPRAFSEIFREAFSSHAIAGGMLGAMIMGFRRAGFSNEAGLGSASIAHSAVRTHYPASEGIVALLEPFIDTVVVCTMTALVIVITNQHLNADLSGVELTSLAFSSQIPWFKYLLALAVMLFAFSTILSWGYYGEKAWEYLFGSGFKAGVVFKLLYAGAVVVGAAISLDAVFRFGDAMIFSMAFPNLIGLVILVPEAKQELDHYLSKIASGEIVRKPRFRR